MHILFALIFWSYGYAGSFTGVRAGVYEKLAQCQQQGAAMEEAVGSNFRFKCIPVNG